MIVSSTIIASTLTFLQAQPSAPAMGSVVFRANAIAPAAVLSNANPATLGGATIHTAPLFMLPSNDPNRVTFVVFIEQASGPFEFGNVAVCLADGKPLVWMCSDRKFVKRQGNYNDNRLVFTIRAERTGIRALLNLAGVPVVYVNPERFATVADLPDPRTYSGLAILEDHPNVAGPIVVVPLRTGNAWMGNFMFDTQANWDTSVKTISGGVSGDGYGA